MRVLATPAELRDQLAKSFDEHSNFSGAVAWAGSNFPLEKHLRRHRNKILRLVVGTHFYQTHPHFIGRYRKHPCVRFVPETDGVFHPKLYYFETNPENWACVIGSPNFTHGGFHRNSEVAMYCDSADVNARDTRAKLLAFIAQAWSQGIHATSKWLAIYQIAWARNRSRRESLEKTPHSKKQNASVIQTKVFQWSWTEYLAHVSADPHHDFGERLAILEIFRRRFKNEPSFASMDLEARQQIAGVAADSAHKWRYFGSMKGAGYLWSALSKHSNHLSHALAQIPMTGDVGIDHYQRYLKELRRAFPHGGCQVGVASRLLAMKRPDVFLCIDRANRTALSKDFGLSPSQLRTDFDAYWTEVIERIQETAWWNEPSPVEPNEKKIWRSRVALLDAIYYDPQSKERTQTGHA